MITYAGVPVLQPAVDLAGWITRRIPPSEAFGFYRPRPVGNPRFDPRPGLEAFLSRPVRISSFYNPWGASRWGIAYILVDGGMLDAIKLSVYDANKAGYASASFTMDDGVGNTIETNLWMLPPVPLSKFDVAPQLPLWLLTLVDDRFFWWERVEPIDIEELTTTWEDVFDRINEIISPNEIEFAPIDADYLFPAASLSGPFQHLPVVIDWTAASVGQRIVRTLDGSKFPVRHHQPWR